MHGRGRRRPGTRAVVALAALVLGVSGLTGCDQSGQDRAGEHATTGARPAPAWDRSPSSVAAVGDSITRGFDACSVLTDCPEVSWATGSDASVHSLAVRLLGRSEAADHSWNYAVTGARMSDLAGQIRRAAAHRPALLTVMVGANDACREETADMTPVADFRAAFESALGQLRAELPRTQVYVASVPDLKRLWSEGRGNPLGRQVWKLGICPSMLADSDDVDRAATKRRDEVQSRVVAYNKVLKEVCAKDRLCRYDGGAVFGYRFGTRQLSHWDWFHPSRDGQSQLAEIAFRTVTAQEVVS